MTQKKLSVKHLQIDKANQAVIIAIVVGVVILVFGLFIGRAMLIRQAHQSRVISAKEDAVEQLKKNVEAKNQIVSSYQIFTSDPINLLKGSSDPSAMGEKDGDNARLILDALPSKYDFPALAASIEKMFIDKGYRVDSVSGTDDEVNQAVVQPSGNPQLVEIPIGMEIKETDYDGTKRVVGLLERSIRPMKIQRIALTSGEGSSMQISLDLLTYYLPEKALMIETKEVK